MTSKSCDGHPIALKKGKILALDIRDEYVTFLKADGTEGMPPSAGKEDGMDNEWKMRAAKAEKLDRIIPGIAKGGAAGRRTNLACLCVSARRQEDIGYGG